MVRTAMALLLAIGLIAGLVDWSAGAAGRPSTQTLVFDAAGTGSFVDKPPSGPSPGDTELSTAKLLDARGHVVGTAKTTCVFTKKTRSDVLERCSSSARTADGKVSLTGVGHLNSMNPPWRATGRSGAYKGAHGVQVFATDIALDPGVPLAAGRGFSVVVIKAQALHRLRVGVVPRPAGNAGFIRRAGATCRAAETEERRLGGFPFSNFDPFHPDPQVLPQVGQFFNQPRRHRLPSSLLRDLRRLGAPPASRRAWRGVLHARQALIKEEDRQINAALAGDAPGFVKTVYQLSRDYNAVVFRSAVFGTQSCTFG